MRDRLILQRPILIVYNSCEYLNVPSILSRRVAIAGGKLAPGSAAPAKAPKTVRCGQRSRGKGSFPKVGRLKGLQSIGTRSHRRPPGRRPPFSICDPGREMVMIANRKTNHEDYQ
jgi:hypothetical protein